MNELRDLIVLLQYPFMQMRGIELGNGVYSVAGLELHVGTSGWSVFPDLLLDEASRTLVGLSFYFKRPDDAKLADVARCWGSDRFTVLNADASECVARYPFGFDSGAYLEVGLATAVSGTQHLAQLDFSSFNWLWSGDGAVPVGLVIHDVDEVMDSFNATLPASVRVVVP
jgi:hypothetical protein